MHLVTSLNYGGLETIVVDLAEMLNRKNLGGCTIYCLDVPKELAKEVNICPVEYLSADRSKFPWDVDAVRKLRQQLLVSNSKLPDKQKTEGKNQTSNISKSVILHAHNMAAWQYAVLASFGTGVKVVYTQHGANIHNRGLKNRLRSIVLSWFTDRIVAVSTDTAGAMVKEQGIPRRRIKIIKNGIDIERFSEREPRINTDKHGWKKNLGIPEDSLIIGSVGRLDHVKGYDVLISAFATLVKRRDAGYRSQVTGDESDAPSIPPTNRPTDSPFLLLVGDGPEYDNLKRQAKELNIDKQVIFAGCQKSVREYLRLMDVFVLPSRSEGISIALLEACACGLPVVVTDVGGNTEVIEDDKTGVVVASDDINALGAAISRLYTDESLRRRMGEAACKHIGDRFSLDATLAEYKTIYSGI
ncbi:MAG: glycosyltransferase [Kiritimatiellae bacterium]|nr:glycosyltransferase [Kiritimatiellia bacterium]MDD5521900.1 glycosyltransferase [Kiritimatiellia bacterium]